MMVNEIDAGDLENRLAAEDDLLLLDIRSEAEVMRGVLPYSKHLPMQMIPAMMDQLPRDKDVVLYCRSGARSYHACIYLMQNGIDNVINLRGGIIDWANRGFLIEDYA